MLMYRNLLEEALESWTDARQGLIDEVSNIPVKAFDFRPTSAVRSVTELVVHILEVAMMMTGELTRTDTNFHRLPWPDRGFRRDSNEWRDRKCREGKSERKRNKKRG